MPSLGRVVKPKTRRGNRALLKREPQLVEYSKTALFIRGSKTNEIVVNCMKDLYLLKKSNSKLLGRRHNIRPFEDATPIEALSTKYDASLFMLASHNKKRPYNLTVGRMFDYHLFDMIELGIDKYKGLKEFQVPKVFTGVKPCLIFNGELFEHNHQYSRLKNLLVDFFRGEIVESIRLQGLEHVISFTATDDMIFCRSYRIAMKKSGTKIPRIELVEIGPSIDFKVKRTHLASDDLFKRACRKPEELKVKKTKNISRNVFGTKLGRIHVPKQSIEKLQTRKMKGLKKTIAEKKLQRAILIQRRKAAAESLAKQGKKKEETSAKE